MKLTLLKSKIHRCTVTHADLDYEGSLTISQELMEAADIHEFEQIQVWNVTRGDRFTTYAMIGERDSGVICVNGAAAHCVDKGDLIIIATFAEMEAQEAKLHTPKPVFVDENNKIKQLGRLEVPGPLRVA